MTTLLPNLLSIYGSLFFKISLLVISAILGLFFNIFTADDKYSLRSSQKLAQPIPMQLFKKEELSNEII